MGARHSGRVLAVQALYYYEISQNEGALSDWRWVSSDILKESILFAQLLVQGVKDHLKEIDQKILDTSQNRDFDRIVKVDLAILRVAIFELLFQNQPLDSRIIIDEAIQISKSMSADDSYKFVNGILDKLSRRT